MNFERFFGKKLKGKIFLDIKIKKYNSQERFFFFGEKFRERKYFCEKIKSTKYILL